jgi:hypothetical protein
MGFQEGVHFIGYRNEEELAPLIRRYLANDAERIAIAERAHDIVWREHTYDSRAQTILNQLKSDGGQLLAPARHWPQEKVSRTYIDHHAAHMYLGCAHQEWRNLARRNPLQAGAAAPFLLKAYVRRVRNSRLFNSHPVPPIPAPSDQETV